MGAYRGSDDVIDRALQLQHENGEWALANCESIDAKIRTGIAELVGAAEIPGDELDVWLDRLKAGNCAL